MVRLRSEGSSRVLHIYLRWRLKNKNLTTLDNTPSGSMDIVTFDVLGYEFMAISAGPLFKFNPSVSFHVKCKTKEEVDAMWKKLSEDGKVLMELGSYPFSERYGWTEDKYGLSWQIVPSAIDEIMESKDKEKIDRVTLVFLKMKKFDIAALKKT